MTASPANFSTVPPCVTMQCETWSKKRLTRRRTTSGSASASELGRGDEVDEQHRCELALHASMVVAPSDGYDRRRCSIRRSSRRTTSAGSIRTSSTRTARTRSAARTSQQFEPRRIAVGRDMRLSSPQIAAAVDARRRGRGRRGARPRARRDGDGLFRGRRARARRRDHGHGVAQSEGVHGDEDRAARARCRSAASRGCSTCATGRLRCVDGTGGGGDG